MTEEQRAIFEVQSYLRNIARLDSSISMVFSDGIFGEETAKAVTDFQRKHAITQTGKVDFETWEKLIEENERAVLTASEPLQIVRITNADLPLKAGMQNDFVYTLKLMLNHVSKSHENFSSLPLDNNFDSDTRQQVILWQEITDTEPSGEVDKLTWNLLAEFYLLIEE